MAKRGRLCQKIEKSRRKAFQGTGVLGEDVVDWFGALATGKRLRQIELLFVGSIC